MFQVNELPENKLNFTLLKLIFSGETMEVLLGKEVDLDDGRETAALTAAAMFEILRNGIKN